MLSSPRVRSAGLALAGPALIVGCVLVVLHDIAFGGLISSQHIDVLPEWVPTYSFLGTSLSAGHIPAWNPYALAGFPFAADPQSGWTYAPPMLLFTLFSAARAIRYFVVLQPILAGLGIYWFARSEGLSRASATIGGLVMAMVMADSYIALTLPFAGTLAWTALLLAAASRLWHAERWSSRLGWLIATCLAWGQLGNAHMSNGLLMGSGALATYLAAKAISDARAGRRSGRDSLALIGLLVVALPAINLAVFLPRLLYLPRTSLALGYPKLVETAAHLAGHTPPEFGVGADSPSTWPLGLASAPGSYLGAAALALSLAAWRSRPRSGLLWAFAAYGAACYLFSLDWLSDLLHKHVESFAPAQLWLHEPARFRYGTLLAIVILTAFGAEAWRRAESNRERILMVAPGVVLWGVLPPFVDIARPELLFLALAAAAGVGALVLAARRPVLFAVVPAVLAVELVVNGFIGQGEAYTLSGVGIERPGRYQAWAPLRRPNVDAAAYVRAGPIVQYLRAHPGSRYIAFDYEGYRRQRGYLFLQRPRWWGVLANQRGMGFGIEDAQGYNPAQLYRYWSFIRSADPKFIKYNAAFFSASAGPVVLDLLQIGWEVAPADRRGLLGDADQVVRDGPWALYQLHGTPPRASAVDDWTVAGSRDRALTVVTSRAFDPETRMILERDPGIDPSTDATDATVRYRQEGPQAATIEVRTDAPVMVLIRTPYDRNWHATVDGRPAPVLAADYVDQAVAVPPGRHTVRLGFDDPNVGRGLAGSAIVLAGLGGAAFALRRRERRNKQAPG